MRLSTLARHPFAIAGAVVTTASAVVFITLVIAMLAGMLNNPYAGLVVFIAIPAVFVIGLAAHPRGHVARATKTASRSNGGFRLARHRFSSRGGTSSNAPHRGPHRGQPRHHSAGRLRRPPRDGNAEFLRTGVPRADAPAVPGLAGRDAFGRCLRRMSHRRGGVGTRPREAFRRSTADDGRRQYVSKADSAGRQDASRRPDGNVQGLPHAWTRRSPIASVSSASMPTTKPTPRR